MLLKVLHIFLGNVLFVSNIVTPFPVSFMYSFLLCLGTLVKKCNNEGYTFKSLLAINGTLMLKLLP